MRFLEQKFGSDKVDDVLSMIYAVVSFAAIVGIIARVVYLA